MDPEGVFATSFAQDQALVRTRSQAVTLGLFVLFMFALPWIADARSVAVMTSMLITAVVVIGLQINTGLAGQINLGQAAFMGAGAYATALLATKGSMPLWIALPIGGVVPAGVGPGFGRRGKANGGRNPGFGNSFYNPLARTPYFGMNNAFSMSFELRDPEQGWTLVERQMLARMVAGPLRWMGLVSLAWDGDPRGQASHSDAAGFSALSLTPVGAWLLGLGPEPEFVEGGGRVVTQPNFTILAMDPVSDATLIDLDHFADPDRKGRG